MPNALTRRETQFKLIAAQFASAYQRHRQTGDSTFCKMSTVENDLKRDLHPTGLCQSNVPASRWLVVLTIDQRLRRIAGGSVGRQAMVTPKPKKYQTP